MAGHLENVDSATAWGGGRSPFNVTYGKMMMWFFLVSDALTFGGFLVALGFAKASAESWPLAEDVFFHFPLTHANWPLIYVALMTFILIVSSVTMVLAVEAGHRMDQKGVQKWLGWTVVGGAVFLGSQAWEWSTFIAGNENGMATLLNNPYNVLNPDDVRYTNFFFFVTGFHGFHVFTGVVINFLVFLQVKKGVYQARGHYEMVEKVGLYWHFVDLVWVFVFTFFYLV
ncbi:MAG: cytochrome c oxidase subunit 3 [Flavobacteriales bacterium]|jgi:cytochrome c oxidase subunit 3|nr:cytochrome c oxidase subunit 3 [bacterium]MDG1176371.1 cytochrome c oxidase subunit 3 [Flavobacteriales bacterium]